MPQIASHESVKEGRKERDLPGGHKGWRTNFLITPGATDEPVAFLAESSPQRLLRTHYHVVDQFQIIVKGGGVLGKHKLAIHAVHFSRAHTPYGPIVNNEQGIGFLTLRARHDPGAQFIPERTEALKSVADRNPWQVTEVPKFEGEGEVALNAFSEIKDDKGLAAYSLKLKPRVKTSAPDPSNSEGQYLVITKGSLIYEGKENKAITIVFVKPHEKSFQLEAGQDGLEALVLNFPKHTQSKPQVTAPSVDAKSATKLRVWQCLLCAFVYDEAKGMPHDGIAPGTRWEDVPEDWMCPDCSAGKSDFQMEVVG